MFILALTNSTTRILLLLTYNFLLITSLRTPTPGPCGSSARPLSSSGASVVDELVEEIVENDEAEESNEGLFGLDYEKGGDE